MLAPDFVEKTKAAIAQITDPDLSLEIADINNCDREPIHIPEAIEVAITDTGAGIEAEAQEKIFEWFYQGAHMRAGSGLGLHLAKRIADMHKGTLTLQSEVGKGSTFTLALPRIKH